MAKEFEQVVCPLCGWRHHINAWKNRYRRYTLFEKGDILIAHVEGKGGKKKGGSGGHRKKAGRGFQTIESKSVTLAEAVTSSKHDAIVQDLKNQTVNMFDLLKSLDVMDESDL